VWPQWPLPSDSDVLRLAQITVPYVRYLHPEIVRAIVQDNEHRRLEWMASLRTCGVDPSVYLWDRSPRAFPGVRRYAGSKEIAAYRGHARLGSKRPKGALRLDDNDSPKQLWSIVFRGAKFAKFGPPGYALAHLADHKAHGNRTAEEFVGAGPAAAGAPLLGLYTSAANTVFIPRTLIKAIGHPVSLDTRLG
jgi:hypothetical protein